MATRRRGPLTEKERERRRRTSAKFAKLYKGAAEGPSEEERAAHAQMEAAAKLAFAHAARLCAVCGGPSTRRGLYDGRLMRLCYDCYGTRSQGITVEAYLEWRYRQDQTAAEHRYAHGIVPPVVPDVRPMTEDERRREGRHLSTAHGGNPLYVYLRNPLAMQTGFNLLAMKGDK